MESKAGLPKGEQQKSIDVSKLKKSVVKRLLRNNVQCFFSLNAFVLGVVLLFGRFFEPGRLEYIFSIAPTSLKSAFCGSVVLFLVYLSYLAIGIKWALKAKDIQARDWVDVARYAESYQFRTFPFTMAFFVVSIVCFLLRLKSETDVMGGGLFIGNESKAIIHMLPFLTISGIAAALLSVKAKVSNQLLVNKRIDEVEEAIKAGVVSKGCEVESEQCDVDGRFILNTDVSVETLGSLMFAASSFVAMCLTLTFSLGSGLSSFPDMLDILLNPFGTIFVALVVVYIFMLIRNYRFLTSFFDKKGQPCGDFEQFPVLANYSKALAWVSVGLVFSLFACFIWLFVHQGDDLTQAIKGDYKGVLSLLVSVVFILVACKHSLKGFYLGFKA